MNTLRDIVKFTGVTGTAGLFLDSPLRKPTMRSVGNLVPLLSLSERTSMLAMIRGLQNLPPITLEGEIEGDSAGQAPFGPQIRVHPSGGVVLETSLNYFLAGQKLNITSHHFVSGTEVGPDGLIHVEFRVAGLYEAVVTRTGITNVGVTVLERRFQFGVAPVEQPQPPPKGPQPPPKGPVFCSVELDLAQPGSGGIVGIRVFGGGFLPPEPVDIIESGQVAATAQADDFGLYSVHMSVLQGQFPVPHAFHARGRTSGRTSTDAGITV